MRYVDVIFWEKWCNTISIPDGRLQNDHISGLRVKQPCKYQ